MFPDKKNSLQTNNHLKSKSDSTNKKTTDKLYIYMKKIQVKKEIEKERKK